MEYLFTLKYQLPEHARRDDVVEHLGAAGCDDALVGVGLPGRVALAFSREADSAKAALFSALEDVRRAVPGAKLIEAAPDFVGLTDVADLLGMSRQNIRKLMVHHAATFPAPVHEGSAAVWHLTDLLSWLQAKGAYEIAADVADVAVLTKQINLANAAPMLLPAMQREVQALLA